MFPEIVKSQDREIKSNIFLTKEMHDLKSAYVHFFNQRKINDGGFFFQQMIKALESHVISNHQDLDVIKDIFGEFIIFFPEVGKGAEGAEGDIKVGLLPLDGYFWENRPKLPGVPGPRWFLYFEVNKNNEIEKLSLRFMSIKEVYIEAEPKVLPKK